MKKVINFIVKLPANILILLIKIYQYTLSPFIGRNCRYTPTCSNYGIEAIRVVRYSCRRSRRERSI